MSKKTNRIFIGDSLVHRMYRGDTLIYQNAGTDPSYITFADPYVEQMLIRYAKSYPADSSVDVDHDGHISFEEAASIRTFYSGTNDFIFHNTNNDTAYSNPYRRVSDVSITSFDEFQYFTGMRELSYEKGNGNTASPGVFNFGKAINLESIVLPDSITIIGQSAFEWCISLTSIVIPDSVDLIGGYAFDHCWSLTSVKLSDNLTIIGQRAFCSCDLRSVVIPASVTRIESMAFYDNTNLESVTILATTPPDITVATNPGTGNDAIFQYSSGSIPGPILTNLTIYVPAASVQTYKTDTNWSYYADVIQAIPE